MIEVSVLETKCVNVDINTNYLNDIGSTEEVGAIVLHIILPEAVCGKLVTNLTRRLLIKNKDGITEMDIPQNGVVKLGIDQTMHPIITLQVKLSEADFTWKTIPRTLTLAESLDYVDDGDDIAALAKRKLGEALTNAIGTSIESVVFGITNLPDFANMSFNSQIAWFDSLKEIVGVAVDRVMPNDDGSPVYANEPVSWSLGKLYDYNTTLLAALKSSLINHYVTAKGHSSPDEMSGDQTLNLLINEQPLTVYDYYDMLDAVSNELHRYHDYDVQHAKDEYKTALGDAMNDCEEKSGMVPADYTESSWVDLIGIISDASLLSPEDAQNLTAYSDILTAASFDETKTPVQMINTYHQITDISDTPIADLAEYNQIYTISDTPIEDLTDYNEIESAAEQTENKNPLDMINVWKIIEREAMTVTNYIPLLSRRMGVTSNPFGFLYSVPYLKTENVFSLTQNADQTLNTNCVSCGFDCSSMDGTGLTTGTVSFFAGVNLPGNPNIQNVKITNMPSITTCRNLFYNCTALKSVDFDGLQATDLFNIFAMCSSLETIALSNSVINDSLALTASARLTQDSVVAVLAATADNVSNKKITFNSAVQLLGDLSAEIAAATAKGWQIVGF